MKWATLARKMGWRCRKIIGVMQAKAANRQQTSTAAEKKTLERKTWKDLFKKRRNRRSARMQQQLHRHVGQWHVHRRRGVSFLSRKVDNNKPKRERLHGDAPGLTEGEKAQQGLRDESGSARNGGGGCDQRRHPRRMQGARGLQPSGPFKMCLINPTSVSKQVSEADVVVTPESKLTLAGQKVVEASLGHEDVDGWKSVWVKPQPNRTRGGKDNGDWDAKQGGITIFVHRPIPIHEQRQDPPEDFLEEGERHLWHEGRFVHACVGVGSEADGIHVLGYDGWRGSRQKQQPAKDNNESGIRQLFKLAAELGKKVPILAMGDFNDEVATSEALQEALSTEEWHDAAAVAALKLQPPGRPQTTFTRGKTNILIDLIFLD